MTTIMSYQSSGGDKKSCTGTCHNAKHEHCTCICGGRYHGSNHLPGGVQQKVKDTWEEAVSEVEKKAEAEGAKVNTNGLRKLIGLEPKPVVK